MDIQDLSIVDNDNQANWTEGSLRVKDVNDAGRVDEGLLARWFADWNGSKITTGTGAAYTMSADTSPSPYYDGFKVLAELHADCAADATLNVDSLGAATILKNGSENLIAGDLKAGMVVEFVYRGAEWNLTGSIYQGTASVEDVGVDIGNVVQLEDVGGAAGLPAVDGSQLLNVAFLGELKWYAAAASPSTDWLIADGAAISRTTYADLFALIGTTYGIGDGSTTFNIPDLIDRSAIGAGTTYALGEEAGEALHTMTEAELVDHTHDIEALGGTGGADITRGGNSNPQNLPTETTGSGTPFNVVHPVLGLTPLIKVL